MDLGAFLDSCSWYDKWQLSVFLLTCIKNSRLQTDTTEILG